RPEYNVALFAPDGTLLGIVDAWWGRAGVAAEVDSQEFHFKREDWLGTKHRVQLLHFPPTQITSAGGAVLADLRDAIAAGLAAPPPPIKAVPQGSAAHLVRADTL